MGKVEVVIDERKSKTHIKMQSQNGGILLNSKQSEKQMSNVTGMMR